MWFCLLQGDVRAEYSWPASLTEIEEEAFAGNTAICFLNIPEGVQRVGRRAFAGCGELKEIEIAESVAEIGDEAFSGCGRLNEVTVLGSETAIGEGTFDGCGEALLIRYQPGSEALSWAFSHRIDYRADTVCRALVIGQTYTGTVKALQGPVNDMRAMRFCLNALGWQTTMRSNLSSEDITNQISTVFASATERDISLFYYSGHGEPDGSLVGKDGAELLSPVELKDVLDQIPGRKIVIVDACYSGRLISEDGETRGEKEMSEESEGTDENSGVRDETETVQETETAERQLLTGTTVTTKAYQADEAARFVSAFQAPFRRVLLQGALNADSYYVITAAREDEESEEGYISSDNGGRIMGFFTNGLCLGLGFDGVAMCAADMDADQNGDKAVSVREAYEYAYQRALIGNRGQHAAVWPVECGWFAPFRVE